MRSLRAIKYFIFFCMSFFLLVPEVWSHHFTCATEDRETEASVLEIFKKKFHEQLEVHYENLVKSGSISKADKARYLKQYENPDIRVCPNPRDISQKVVYIEYEKDWWGSLYFALVKDGKVSKWMAIETYGAITERVKWEEEGFFYEESTHRGTKTQNTCLIRENSVECERVKNST